MSKVGFVSLGCPKALVDSELILTRLSAEGYEISKNYDSADIVIVNTCGFIDSAVEESLNAISEALQENGKVIVTGCLGQRSTSDGQNLIKSIHPAILGITGPHATNQVLDLVHTHLPKPHDPFMDLVSSVGVKLTPKHFSYLKISEGCNHRCSFCIIPSMRGDLVSRPINEVLLEAKKLFESGVKELLVISQDTSAYGVDISYRVGFWEGRPIKSRMYDLVVELKALARNYDSWVRLHYVYPYPHVDDLIPLMIDFKEFGNGLLPYLDVPLQHSHPDVLKRMKRPASGEKNLERITSWRKVCPDLIIRSTFIVGFPGETEEEFNHLLDFLNIAQLDRVGCFPFSPVDGAKANDLPGQLPLEIRNQRRDQLMKLAENISVNKLSKNVGKKFRVLIDEINNEGGIGRTFADAPEIDGLVYVAPNHKASKRYKIGDFIKVTIYKSDGHDLLAEI